MQPPLRIDESAIDDWNEAYVTVESYLCALGLRNKLLLSRSIHRILNRAEARISVDPTLRTSSVAMEETILLVAEWFSDVTGVQLPEKRLSARGRLALLLADLSGANQHYFLADPPLPENFIEVLRESYLKEGPAVSHRAMTPRPITLNPIMRSATVWWESLNRIPIFKALLITTVLGTLGTLLLLFFWR